LEEHHQRTFYRRARHWHATAGPEREVFFAQDRKPGELLQLDWAHARELGVTIQGELLDHLLCHCVLPYSNWECDSSNWECDSLRPLLAHIDGGVSGAT
jgi:hypothetical protein